MDRILEDATLIAAARRLRPEGAEPEEAVARAAWSVIAEPGDGVAGALIAELGAVDALRIGVGEVRGSAFELDDPEFGRRALAEARKRWRQRASVEAVRDALEGAYDVGAALLLPSDPEWPRSLDDLGVSAPSALWTRGDARLLGAGAHLSMVGARASSAYGDQIASEISGDLAGAGAVIVSGGAYGIDGAAHRAALGVSGATVAFLAGGVDRAYPAGHAPLLRRIAEQGVVVSELPCGAAPTKWRFLARNRLIAALGDATVVVEAGWRSGSLNTAGHASALGRPLGAVPGPVTSTTSAGCHRLLREYDAICVTSSADVRELFRFGVEDTSPTPTDPNRVRLLDAMSTRSALSAGELARRAGMSTSEVSSMLGLLELEGAVERTSIGWCRRSGRGVS